MTDLVMQMARQPGVRRVVEALGLPLPLPRVLERADGPWQRRELAGRVVAVAGFGPGALADAFAHVLAETGACASLHGGAAAGAFQLAGEAFGAPPDLAGARTFHALVVDATDLSTPRDLRVLYDRTHHLVSRLPTSGRLVVLGRPAAALADPLAAAAAAALEGFMRSAAKELGRRGATAQLVTIAPGAEDRAAAITRFLLSSRSAFVTAQVLHATLAVPATRSLEWVRALDQKVALVTGAARGIGEAIARRLAAEGAHVVCVDRPAEEAALAAVSTAIRGSLLLADLREASAADAIAAHLCAHHTGVDIVVHNAGVTRDRTLARMTADEWDAVVDVNLAAVARVTSALLPDLLRDGGRVTCLSSIAGLAGNVGQTNYAASKAGLVGYVRALAAQLAPRGITVNAVAPGFIETRMTAAIPLAIREAGRRLSALGQGGQPGDVAEVITFLAQPAAVGITGAVLRVCGGALIGA